MCLNTKQTKPLKATKDMIVYKTLGIDRVLSPITTQSYASKGNKVFEVTREVKLSARTRNFGYDLGKTYKTTIKVRKSWDGKMLFVESGFHSYNYKTPASVRRVDANGILVECVIPKGSTYYEGTNNGHSKGIVSNQIRVVRVI